MKKEDVRIAVVGLGRGLDLAKGVIKNKGCRIAAICDLLPERRATGVEFCRANNITDYEVFEDYEQVLASPDIDAVILATDQFLHTPMSIKAIEAGKHVFSEIPAVNSIEDIKNLKAAVKAHPEVKYFCGENGCYLASVDQWKKMNDSGMLGEIAFAEAEYLHTLPIVPPESNEDGLFTRGWRYKRNAITYLTHDLGPLLYIMDDECVSVSCMVPKAKYNPYMTGQQNGIALFQTKNGAVIKIFIGYGIYAGCDHNAALYGTKGCVFTDRTKHFAEAKCYAKLDSIPGTDMMALETQVTAKYPGEPGDTHGGADTKMIRDFVSCIVDDTKPKIDIDLAINMALPGMIAVESAKNGGELMEIPKI